MYKKLYELIGLSEIKEIKPDSLTYTCINKDGVEVWLYKKDKTWYLTEQWTGMALKSVGYKTKREAEFDFLAMDHKLPMKTARDSQVERLTKAGIFLPNHPIRQTESFRMNVSRLESEHDQSMDYQLAKMAGYVC